MNIDIAQALCNEGEMFSADYNGPMDSIDFLGQRFDFRGGIRANANYHFNGEGIVVLGSFEAGTHVACSRCLKTFLYTVKFDFAEYYKKQQEDGAYMYEGETINLDQMLQDNVVLSLPVKFLCSDDCKGLCPLCGTDLNEQMCGCENEIDEDNPFYGLSKLYDDEEV